MTEMTTDLGVDAETLAGLDAYRATSHGENEWTPEAVANIIYVSRWMRVARGMIDGKFSSVYRSATINAKVGGVANSRHVLGLACDIIPGTMDSARAADVIYQAAANAMLGHVQQIIHEPSWVHVAWLSRAEVEHGISFLKKTNTGYANASRPSMDKTT